MDILDLCGGVGVCVGGEGWALEVSIWSHFELSVT